LIESIQYISLVQASVVGVILFFFKKKQHYHFRYLSLFLLLLFLGIANELTTNVIGYEFHILTAFNFQLLLPNLIYLHVCSNMNLVKSKKFLLINFIPGIIEFILLVAEAILVSNDIIHEDSTYLDYFYDVYVIVVLIYVIFIQVLIFRTISKYNSKLYEYFSTVNYKYLNWLKWVCVIIIVNEVYYILFYFSSVEIPNEEFYYLVYAVLELIIIYYVSIHALIQINLNTHLDKEIIIEQIPEVDLDNLKIQYDAIVNYLSVHKPFLDAELNLKSLASSMTLPQKNISKAINNFSGTNFHGFINKYRVKEAKKLLIDKESTKFSMIGIGEKAGFNSKSSFYNNFKKEVGLSPKQYMDEFI
jgi:AraC-like DNA-binding protein